MNTKTIIAAVARRPERHDHTRRLRRLDQLAPARHRPGPTSHDGLADNRRTARHHQDADDHHGSSTTDAPPTPPRTRPPPRSRRQPSHDPPTLVDELVPVHGAGLHLHCDGAGPTTVVLIAGFNADRDSWAAGRTDRRPDHPRVFLRPLRYRHKRRATGPADLRDASRRPPHAAAVSWRAGPVRRRRSLVRGRRSGHLRLDVPDRSPRVTPARRQPAGMEHRDLRRA